MIRNFGDDFEKKVQLFPDRIAVLINEDISPTKVTYRELDRLITNCLQLFEDKGLRQGDIILSLMPNSLENLVLFLATIKGGFGFAPLHCHTTIYSVENKLRIVKPAICFTSTLVNQEIVRKLGEQEFPMVTIARESNFAWLPQSTGSFSSQSGGRIYLSTSGTTGAPKAMVLESDKVWSNGFMFAETHGLSEKPLRFWNYLPMSYLGGLFNLSLIPLAAGGSTVIDDAFSGKTFLSFWQTVERFDINALWLVPTIVRGLLQISQRINQKDLTRYQSLIEKAFIGTAPIDLQTKKEFEEVFNVAVYENYGLSETTFITSETKETHENRREHSVGEILPEVEIKLVETNDSDTNHAEIFIKSPYLFTGYLTEDGAIESPFTEDGFLPTGDLGYLNESNQLILTGRSRDVIKKGGLFIALREVEIVAEKHENVKEAVAVKIAHDFYGEDYNLFVVSDNATDSSFLQEFNSYIHANLEQYKWPAEIIQRDSFPRTESGKIQKHRLTEQE